MIIQNNLMALNAQGQLLKNSLTLAKSLEKMSSGYKINRAGDDAAGLAISEKMRAQIKGLDIAARNALDGISMIQTSEGALTEVHSMLNRMAELSTQSANGIYSDTERQALNAEFQQLKSEIDRISQATNFNGKNLLDGSMSESLQIGDTGDNYNKMGVSVGDMSTKGLGLADIGIETIEGASAAIGNIKDSINAVSSQRAELGAGQNKLEHTISNLAVTTENLIASESRIRDTDMALEMMNFTRASILQQANQSMLAHANLIPQGVLSMLWNRS